MIIKHLEERNMKYYQHVWEGLKFCGRIAVVSIWTAIIVFIHTICPWWFEDYAKQLAKIFE
jgi:hypothetical protein